MLDQARSRPRSVTRTYDARVCTSAGVRIMHAHIPTHMPEHVIPMRIRALERRNPFEAFSDESIKWHAMQLVIVSALVQIRLMSGTYKRYNECAIMLDCCEMIAHKQDQIGR